MSVFQIVLLVIIAARASAAMLRVGKLRQIDGPEDGFWNVVGWAILATLVVFA